MEKTIRFTDVFITLKKRWKLILFVTLVAVSIGSCLTYFVLTPVYQGSTQILVNQKGAQNQLDTSQLQSNVDLINTYSVIIKSPAILDKVINKLGLPQNAEQLNKKILVTSQENSQVFSVTVEDEDAAMAVEIANTVSETFQKEIQNIMNVDNVSILAAANLKENPIPVKPIPFFNITISLVIGLIAGFGIAILLEFMDSTLKNDQDIAECLGMPVLGAIPKMSKSDNRGKRDSTKQKIGSDSVAS